MSDLTTHPIPPESERDAEHLRLLVIGHKACAYLAAGLILIVFPIGILLLRWLFGVAHPFRIWDDPDAFPLILILFCIITIPLNLLSARFIRLKKYRRFSLTVAGVNCLCLSLSTLLGVFTFMVLLRDSVIKSYGRPA